MTLDLHTLFLVTVYVEALLGLLLVLAVPTALAQATVFNYVSGKRSPLDDLAHEHYGRVKEQRFEPARVDGKAAPMVAVTNIEFRCPTESKA